MLGAGTIINPILKVVTTVAILAAAYIFIVKPILETTDNAIDRSFDAFNESFEGFDGFDDLPGQIQSDLDDALDTTNDPKALQQCIKRAIDGDQPDARRIDRCVGRFTN